MAALLPPQTGRVRRVDCRWPATNRTLAAWLESKRPALGAARGAAASIRQRLEALFPLMDDLCRTTCPWCPDPCCIVTRVWFDFRDLLFFHLVAIPIPPAPIGASEKSPCIYLSARGCRLPRLRRPWACIQYVCGTQRRLLLKTRATAGLEALEAEIAEIGRLRIAMEEAVVKAADRRRGEKVFYP